MLNVRLAASPGEDLGGRPAPASRPPSTRQVEWRGFQADGFALERHRTDLRRPRPRPRVRPRRAAASSSTFTGTTDARAFVVHDDTPATCYGPIGGNLHAPDEWVDLESVRDTTLVLAEFAAEWCR